MSFPLPHNDIGTQSIRNPNGSVDVHELSRQLDKIQRNFDQIRRGGPGLDLMAIMHDYGQDTNYSNSDTGFSSTPTAVRSHWANATPLNFSYRPPVDCILEQELMVSNVRKYDAAYHYMQFTLHCSPADVYSDTLYYGPVTIQHGAVNYFQGHFMNTYWTLQAGTYYTFSADHNISGGTWGIYHGPYHLRMTGKAWAL